MATFTDFVYRKSQALAKEALTRLKKESERLAEDSFKEGKLTSEDYIHDLFNLYRKRMTSYLNDLYFETCEHVVKGKYSFRDIEGEFRKELQIRGDAFFESWREKFLSYNTGAQENSKLFQAFLDHAREEYQQIQEKLSRDLPVRAQKERFFLDPEKLKEMIGLLQKYPLQVGIGFVVLIVLFFLLNPIGINEKQYRLTVDKAEELVKANKTDEALLLYDDLLKKISRKKQKLLFGHVKNKQGETYYQKLKRTKNLKAAEKALRAFQEALTIFVIDEYPFEFATTQKNIGVVYLYLPEIRHHGKRLRQILQENTKVPQSQRQVVLSLNDSFSVLDEKGDLKQALKAFREALRIFTKEKYPLYYSIIQVNLGNLYYKLSHVEKSKQNLEKSLETFEEALQFFTEKDYPVNYALIQNGMSVVSFKLSEFGQRKTTYERAFNRNKS